MNMEEALAVFGTRYKIADALGLSRQAVYQWEEIPPLRVYQLKEIIAKQQQQEAQSELP